jgi:hypothetical protein
LFQFDLDSVGCHCISFKGIKHECETKLLWAYFTPESSFNNNKKSLTLGDREEKIDIDMHVQTKIRSNLEPPSPFHCNASLCQYLDHIMTFILELVEKFNAALFVYFDPNLPFKFNFWTWTKLGLLGVLRPLGLLGSSTSEKPHVVGQNEI